MLIRFAVLAVFGGFWGHAAFAAEPVKPGDVRSLAVHPSQVRLTGGDDAVQLVVTATLADGRPVDVTHTATYAASEAVSVSDGGRVIAKANGHSPIVVRYGDHSATVPATAAHVGESLPINFPNQVVPVLTKLGCNSGGCHGKASGQNGFALSLLGFEPQKDYSALVEEARGRRVFPAAPEQSLLLRKAVGQMPHGGGRKMEIGSDEYKVVRRWIAAGLPYGSDSDPTVTKIVVHPDHRVLGRTAQQQVSVTAHYSDGSTEDVTSRTQYESNDTEIAVVDGEGLVRTLTHSGEAAVMARYQGHVATFRATVPLGEKTPAWEFAAKTVVDGHTAAKWRTLGLVPSGLCSDEQFIRRVYLDVTGTLPTPKQVQSFVADRSADKRDKLIDALVETPEYADYFANKWAGILRVKRQNQPDRAAGTFAFHAWIRESIAADRPYDEFARAIVCATGDESRHPPVVWYKEVDKPEQFVDDVSQVFLGQRLACANCHHHPYEKWGQDDYWGLAAFYGRVGRKQIATPGVAGGNRRSQELVIFTRAAGSVTNKRTNKPAEATPLDGEPMELEPGDDPRQALADWMTSPENPFFARTVANRYWAHFFGRGIVDPLDDMRVTNPPSNPALLDALAKDLTDNNYSLKALVKTICKSRTYQLSAVPNEFNKHDRQAFARYYPKRLSAEVLLDAVDRVTATPTQFAGLPQDRFAPQRAVQLPDESFRSYFLDVFGRPQRQSACECERVNEANLAQALHLLNSNEVQQKVTSGSGRAAKLAADPRPDAQKVEELFLWAFARKPTAADQKAALAHIAENEKAKKTAYENILWALLNTKEFAFNQ